MPAPPAPPPAAPVQAPAAPPASTPKGTPPAPKEPPMNRQDLPESDWMKEAGSELEELDRSTNQIRPPRPAQGNLPPKGKKKDDQPPKPNEQVPDEDVINPGDEPAAGPKPEDQPPAEGAPVDQRPLKAPELRKAYQESQKRIKEELEPELNRLQSRVKELEASGPKDTEQTTERLKQIESRNQQLESFIRLKHYEQSQEYADKYQKPYAEAWDKCLRDISQLKVEVPDGQGGYVTRQATDADITRLAALPLGDLIKESNAMFGDAADVVREHVKEINRTYQAQAKALQEAEKRSEELAKNSQNQTMEKAKQREQLWETNNTDLSTKFPDYFAPKQGDESGNKLLNAGFAFADLLFQSGTLTPDKLALLPDKYRQEIETKGALSPELTVRAHAIIRNKAANHDRLVRQLKAIRKELEDANATIASYEESEPSVDGNPPSRGSGGGGHWADEANNEIDQLDRRGA